MADKKKIIASDNIPQAPDIEAVVEKRITVIPSDNIPQASDIEAVTEEIRTKISTEIPISEANNPELKNIFIPFDGKWMPDNEPIEIGIKNYKTLQNYRYGGDEIIHLEGVKGYSKINTTALTDYTNIRNGHQLKGQYIPTLTDTTIAFVDGGGGADTITDSGSRFVSTGFEIGMTINIFGSASNDSEYTLTAVAAGTLTLSTGVLTTEAASESITVTGIAKSYVLVHAEHTLPKSNKSLIYQNQTAIPRQGDFSATALHTDLDYNLKGRFSDAPGGQITYCNSKESCIWAGEEMRCAGFFTFFIPKYVGSEGLSFSNSGGVAADSISDSSADFIAAGFKAGQTVVVTGSTLNNGEFKIITVAKVTLYLEMEVLTDENNTSATVMASIKSYHQNAMDYTDRINNTLETGDQIVHIDGDTTGNMWMILSTRPLQGIKYYLKNVNGTDSATTTCKAYGQSFFSGGDFHLVLDESDGTISSGSMKQSGTYSFIAPSVKPMHWEGLYLYAYLFELSAGSADIYHITLDAPFQNMVDIWDGVFRQPVQFQLSRGFTAEASGTDSDGVIKTVQAGSLPLGHSYGYTQELTSSTDYENVDVGTEITANSETHTITDKYKIDTISWAPSWCGFRADGADYTIDTIILTNSQDNFNSEGLRYGDSIIVTGTTNNNGTYTLSSISPNGKEAYFNGAGFTDENCPGTATLARTGHYYIDVDAIVDWYNAGDGYSFTYKNLADITGAGNYEDFTLEVNEESYADYPIGAVIDELTNNNHILIGFEERMSAMWFEMIANHFNANPAKMTVSYWSGTGYSNAFLQTDGTYGPPGPGWAARTFNRSGLVSWRPPDERYEFRQTLFGMNLYFYRITVDATLSGTEGEPNEVIIDTVKGIPAQQTVRPYKFSAQYKNRAMLCGYTAGKEGNRVDYSVTNAPDVFNGDESSMDGIQSLYIGGGDDLTCGIELFNRFGSNIISSFLFFKNNEAYILTGDGPDNYKTYTMSRNTGCPAPLTLCTAETGYTFAEEINRNIAIWISYSGPMIFDGATIVPIQGIKKYFDPAKSTCVNFSIIEKCRGWFDATYKEYNLLIPSGSSATECNVWLMYDLVRKRWFEKIVGASEMPQCAFPVLDTDGVQYIYAGIDDGHVMRLENGNTWADANATPLIQVIETGDFFPTADIWEKARLRRFKMAVKTISEADKNIQIKHYIDTATLANIIEGTIAFTDNGASPDTITDSGNGFVTAGFSADQTIHVTTQSGTNDGSYTIATVVAGTITLIATDALTTENASTAGTVMIDNYSNILTALNADSGSGDITKANQACNLLAWCHRFRFTIFTASTSQLHPILWGVQFYVEREDID